jgi:peptide deformylase
VVRYQNLSGKEMKLEAQADLLCRAIQHEVDHLDGEVFVDKAVSRLVADLELSKHGFGPGGQPDYLLEEQSAQILEQSLPTRLVG